MSAAQGESMTEKIPEVLVELGGLAEALGVSNIRSLPGCWEHQIDADWWIALNGHSEPVKCSHGFEVRPFAMYAECRGWLAGIVDAGGGVMLGAVCEDELIAAIQKAKAAVREP